jgi:hypothetical protein
MGLVVSVTLRPRLIPGDRTLGDNWIESWVGLRADLDTEAREEILCPPGIEPWSCSL